MRANPNGSGNKHVKMALRTACIKNITIKNIKIKNGCQYQWRNVSL